MGIEFLQQWWTTPIYARRDIRTFIWMGLAVVCALTYSFMGLQQAFAHANVIHDDVRSHVFWMHRFMDADLFPNDVITDYFQSVAPYGYTQLYQTAAGLGIEPLVFNKLLPLVLVLLTTVYGFWLTMRIFPVPAAAFLATLLLNQTTWSTHDIPSGTPRAFIYPLFIAFLYYLVQRSLLPCLITIVLQGLFYPQCLFLSSGILVLRLLRVQWGKAGTGNGSLQNWRSRFQFSPDRQDYWFCGLGLAIVFFLLLPYALKISDYGPVLSRTQGLGLPTLQDDGRKNFFFDDPLKFWFCGERSGMLPYNWCKYEEPPQLWATLWLLPMLAWVKRFPLLEKTTQHLVILPQIFVASLGMFFMAHLLLFRLHLPSRYTKHSLRVMVAIAASIALVCLLDTALRWLRTTPIPPVLQNIGAIGAVGLLSAYSFSHPILMDDFPNPDYVNAQPPELYDFFAQQPKDIMIASLSEVANNIPSLSKRSILTGSEIANPYHFGYYQIIHQRTEDLFRAQYSTNRNEVLEFIQTYNVDFWLSDRNAFHPDYIVNNPWLRQIEPFATQIQQVLKDGKRPVIARVTRRCQVLETHQHTVLDTQCIQQTLAPSTPTS